MREVWLDIPEYEGFYEVSNLGNVRRAITSNPTSGTSPGKFLTPSKTQGYLHVSLSKNGSVVTHRVHTLVMTAFCGKRPFEGSHICHNDGNPENCRLDNLRWDNAYGNQADVERHGRRVKGSDVYGAKLHERDVFEIRQRLSKGHTCKSIAEDYDVSTSTIHLIKQNKTWRHV